MNEHPMVKRTLAGLLLLLLAAGCGTGDTGPGDTGTSDVDSSVAGGSPPTSLAANGAPALPPPDSVKVGVIPPDSATRARYNATMDDTRRQNLAERPVGQIIQALGRRFLGRPYLIGPLDQTLDENPPEQLVCRLDGFDCFTFDEALLAMARTVKDGSYSYDEYKDYTRRLRYRDGEIGYCNRQHYYTAFVRQAEEEGVLRNITDELGGRRRPGFRYGFMSAHRSEYPQMARSDSLYKCIQNVEERLNRTMTYRYIPQDSIRAVYDELEAGDLISTATGIDGLDVTHTGLVYKQADTTGLLHASTSGGVKISPDLQRYVQGVDSQTGIIVARPIFGEGGPADDTSSNAGR